MSITPKQREALKFIADNPARVTSGHDDAGLKLHGNTANSLIMKRLIEAYNPNTLLTFHEERDAAIATHGEDKGEAMVSWHNGGYCWRLTDAGREALRSATPKTRHVAMNKPPVQQNRSNLGRKLAQDHGLNFF